MLSTARLTAPNSSSATTTPQRLATRVEDAPATLASPRPGLSQAPQVFCSPPTQENLLDLRWINGPAGPSLRGCKRRWNVFKWRNGARWGPAAPHGDQPWGDKTKPAAADAHPGLHSSQPSRDSLQPTKPIHAEGVLAQQR